MASRFRQAGLEALRKELEQSSTAEERELLQNAGQDSPSRRDAPGTGIGLGNVLARLRLVCGDNALLTVDNLKEGGVIIRLEIDIVVESERI
ncbi:hypothetical protein ACFSQ7_45290 [Paenibacillus rhizoplanae]